MLLDLSYLALYFSLGNYFLLLITLLGDSLNLGRFFYPVREFLIIT